MSFVDAIKTCVSKYADFTGRARRSEYWYWMLFIMIVSIGLLVSMSAEGSGGRISTSLLGLFYFGTFLPTTAVMVRRMQDSGCSGWQALSVLKAHLLFADSDVGENEYGPSPKGPSA